MPPETKKGDRKSVHGNQVKRDYIFLNNVEPSDLR